MLIETIERFQMIKRKRKRNPLKEDKKLMRKVAELLAKAIEKEPDGIKSYLLAAELVRRDSLYCEECHSYDIEEGCDWDICYPEMDELLDESTLDMAKEAAEELAEDLGIRDYVKVFRYSLQRIRYEEKKDLRFRPFIVLNISNLVGTDLSGLYLPRVDLFKSDLSGADLSGADLSGADLSRVDLSEANLSGADLYGADLSGADLSGADLSGADLAETNFTNAKINNVTGFSNTRNLKHAINLVIPNPRKAFINAKKKTKKKSNKTKIGRRNIK